MLRLLSKVAFTISGHDVRQGVLTGYPTTYPNNGNRALNAMIYVYIYIYTYTVLEIQADPFWKIAFFVLAVACEFVVGSANK